MKEQFSLKDGWERAGVAVLGSIGFLQALPEPVFPLLTREWLGLLMVVAAAAWKTKTARKAERP